MISTDFIAIKFEIIRVEDDLLTTVKTPSSLESLVLKHYPLKKGEFMFLEWTKFTEDILVTSDRSALISSQTSNVRKCFIYFICYIIFIMTTAATQIYKVLTMWIYRFSKLQSVLKSTTELSNSQHSHFPKRMETSAPPNANYDILISIFQPRPDQQRVRWDVRAAIDCKRYYLHSNRYNFTFSHI